MRRTVSKALMKKSKKENQPYKMLKKLYKMTFGISGSQRPKLKLSKRQARIDAKKKEEQKAREADMQRTRLQKTKRL